MNKKRVHGLVAPIGIHKQAYDTSFRFHYTMNKNVFLVLLLQSVSTSKLVIPHSAFIIP
ncbi:MAG: hypothetical protein QM644_13710 [Mobilitalea sp.]